MVKDTFEVVRATVNRIISSVVHMLYPKIVFLSTAANTLVLIYEILDRIRMSMV